MKKLLTLLAVLCITGDFFAQGRFDLAERPDSVLQSLMEELEVIDDDSLGNFVDSLQTDSVDETAEGILMKNDSTAHLEDSLLVQQDSLMIRIDSLALANDSLVTANDSLKTNLLSGERMDSLMNRLDNLLKMNDSLMVVRDSLIADSIRKVEEWKKNNTPQLVEARKIVADYKRFRDQWTDRWNDIYLYSSDIVSDANFYKLAMPATYYNAPIEEAMSIEGWKPGQPFGQDGELIPYPLDDVRQTEKVDRYVNQELLGFYTAYPQLVKQNESVLKNLAPLSKDLIVTQAEPEKLREMVNPVFEVGQVTESDLLVLKPNFWTLGGGGYLNFSQNFISDNWYKGGESSVSLLSGLEFQANFDNRQKVQFENKLEWKLGFMTTPSDTVHAYKANNDLFRITSKLGVRAFKNWYYTLSLEFKTQFFSNYATNSNNLVSALLSPAELNIGIGLDYKFIKEGKCNLSVLLKPLNYTLHSVLSDRVDPTKFNIEKGHKVENVIGSRMDLTLKWAIAKSLVWESKFIYSTNYEQSLADWENRFMYSFNKFLSTNLFVNARFDDGVTKKPDESYFQLQELLGFGVSYVW